MNGFSSTVRLIFIKLQIIFPNAKLLRNVVM